jgi:FK506-binding protein 4/5
MADDDVPMNDNNDMDNNDNNDEISSHDDHDDHDDNIPDNKFSDFSNAVFNSVPDAEGWIQVTEDGGIKKKILSEGSGDTYPIAGSDVFCHYVGTLVSTGNKFDSSRDRNSPFNFQIGQGNVIKGWDRGIATMKKGEKCILRCRSDYAYGAQSPSESIPANSDLDFEVELLDWSNWKRVNSKDDFKKQIIISGDGADYDTPNEDAKCIISYQLKLNDEKGQIIIEEQNVSFIIEDEDEEKYPKGFHDAIKDMKKKSQVEFKIASQYMWKDKGNAKLNIPPNTDIYLNVTLHDFNNAKQSYEMNNIEKYNDAQLKKNQGNELFKQEKYQRALKKYKKCLDLINDIGEGGGGAGAGGGQEEEKSILKEHEQDIKELKISCNNNLAMVYIKLKEYIDAISKCDEIITKIDSNNIKAWTRKGYALYLDGDYEKSKEIFKYALTLPNLSENDNKYINQYLNLSKHKIKEYQEKQKKIYSKMFK